MPLSKKRTTISKVLNNANSAELLALFTRATRVYVPRHINDPGLPVSALDTRGKRNLQRSDQFPGTRAIPVRTAHPPNFLEQRPLRPKTNRGGRPLAGKENRMTAPARMVKAKKGETDVTVWTSRRVDELRKVPCTRQPYSPACLYIGNGGVVYRSEVGRANVATYRGTSS